MPRAKDILLASLMCVAALAAPPAFAATVNETADYIVSLAGANIASVAVTLKDDGRAYSLALDAKVAGLGQFVTSGTAAVDTNGSSAGNSLTPQDFVVETKTRNETFSASVQYAGGNVTGFKVDPPVLNNIGRVPIERSQLSDVGDMLSAFVFKGGSLDKSLCQRQMRIFTGLERFNVSLRFNANDQATSPRTGYQGPVVMCSMKYTPVSGHYTNSEITTYLARSDKLLIWYAPLRDTDYFIPYRVLIGTGIGDLSMVLTSIDPQ